MPTLGDLRERRTAEDGGDEDVEARCPAKKRSSSRAKSAHYLARAKNAANTRRTRRAPDASILPARAPIAAVHRRARATSAPADANRATRRRRPLMLVAQAAGGGEIS